MWTFRRDRDGGYVARLDAVERSVLLDVVDEVVQLLGGEQQSSGAVGSLESVQLETAAVPPPEDPAVRRLLPDVSDDPAAAAEFRRLTEADLRAAKVGQLLHLRAVVTEARPDALVLPSEAPAVAAALTDLRLVLAERLGVRTEADAEALHHLVLEEEGPAGPDDPLAARRFLATVATMLSALQESLVGLMLAELPDAPG